MPHSQSSRQTISKLHVSFRLTNVKSSRGQEQQVKHFLDKHLHRLDSKVDEKLSANASDADVQVSLTLQSREHWHQVRTGILEILRQFYGENVTMPVVSFDA